MSDKRIKYSVPPGIHNNPDFKKAVRLLTATKNGLGLFKVAVTGMGYNKMQIRGALIEACFALFPMRYDAPVYSFDHTDAMVLHDALSWYEKGLLSNVEFTLDIDDLAMVDPLRDNTYTIISRIAKPELYSTQNGCCVIMYVTAMIKPDGTPEMEKAYPGKIRIDFITHIKI